jgi:YcxB-like protein
MNIKYRVSERDYRSAALLELRKRDKWSLLEFYSPYIIAIVWVCACFIPDDFDLFLTLGIIPIFIAVLWMRRRRFENDYRRKRNFHLLHSLDLDRNGLRLETTDGSTRVTWANYLKFAEDADNFVLFQKSGHGFFPIPKDHLTPEQVEELGSMLQSRLRRAE